MNKTKKKVVTVSVVALMVFILIAVFILIPTSSSTPEAPLVNPIPPDVIISFEPFISGKLLTINGAATVPDGAFIAYEVTSKDLPALEAFADGNAEVKDGKWVAMADLSKFPKGQIEIWAAFQTILGTTTHQPPEILRIYGEMGEKITGPQTKKSGDITRAEIVKTINY